jgi:hypothetical protein
MRALAMTADLESKPARLRVVMDDALPAKAPERAEPPGGPWSAFSDGGTVPASIVLARAVMVVALALTVPALLSTSHGNRFFWTIAIASLPLFWVIAGFHVWRRICPLAVAGQLGRLVGRPGARRVSGWLAEHYLVVQLAILWACLSLRLVATNGSASWLAGFVVSRLRW